MVATTVLPPIVPAATLEDCVRAHAARMPDREAVITPDAVLSWEQLDRGADALAGALRAHGAHPGDRIGWLGRNRASYVTLLVAARRAGLVIVGINWRLSVEEIAYIVADAAPHVVVADMDLRVLLPVGTRLIASERGDHELIALQDLKSADYSALPRGSDDPLFLCYTSGTTGRPKGVLYPREAVERMLRHPHRLEFEPDSVLQIVAPVFHIAGGLWTQYALIFGLTQVLLAQAAPGAMLEAIERWRVTHVQWVPTIVQMALHEQRLRPRRLESLHLIAYGAAPMPVLLLREAAAAFGCRFTQVYGMTESVGPICHLPHEAHPLEGPISAEPPPTGFPDPGVQMRIVAPGGNRAVGAGETGEVVVRMPRPNPSYWSLPPGAQSAFDAEGWLHTGDAGFLDEDGCLHLTDRISELIISGGENVYPAEVEAVLTRIPEIDDAAVFGVPDQRWGESVRAVVVLKPGAVLDTAAAVAYCRSHLAHFKCPRRVVIAPDLPRTALGKVARRELRARFGEEG